SCPPQVPVSTLLPSGEKAAAHTCWLSSRGAFGSRLGKTVISSLVRTSHTRAARSVPPVRMCLPSGEKATARTVPACAGSSASALPVATSQTITLPSPPPLTARVPSGEKATHRTLAVWPAKRRTSLLVLRSHRRRSLSIPWTQRPPARRAPPPD